MLLAALVIFGWLATWEALGLPALSPAFADMRTVQAALEATAQGLNPQLENPSDPWGRTMNYPSPWLWIAKTLNFQIEAGYLAFVSATILAYLYVCGKVLVTSRSVWVLLFIFSGAPLLAVERGNNDLVIFALLYFAAHTPANLRPLPLMVATALKLYPVVVLPALIKNKLALIVFAVGSALVFAALWSELVLIRSGTPSSGNLSYGSESLSLLAMENFQTARPALLISAGLGAMALLVFLTRGRRLETAPGATGDTTRRLFLFGACIYCGTFVIGSNWDYRLIFLILCTPHILALPHRSMRYLILICIGVALNQLWLEAVAGSTGFYLNIAAKCVLFVVLAASVLKLLMVEAGDAIRWPRP